MACPVNVDHADAVSDLYMQEASGTETRQGPGMLCNAVPGDPFVSLDRPFVPLFLSRSENILSM
jgi:hypothetical protein